jgi:alkane 1-monooxygenase
MAAIYLLPFVFLAAVPLACRAGAIWLVLPAFVLVFTLFDSLLGTLDGMPVTKERAAATHRVGFRLLLWAYIPLQLGLIAWGCGVASGAVSTSAMLGLAFATGATSGIFGMLAAHEMIHSRHRAERGLGLAMLVTCGYGHFRIAHRKGHHRHAATSADPATARLGENAYGFVPRSVIGQFVQAWRYESRRLLRANRMLRYLAMSAALYVALGVILGGKAIAFGLLQSVVAILILELFNYIAHYGLVRRRLSNGRFEPLAPQHSWNAPQRFNNWALFNGGRHSDHHRRPAEAYQALRPLPASPQLPFGYAGSIMLALVPPLWRRTMDPRAQRWTATASGRENYSRGTATSMAS